MSTSENPFTYTYFKENIDVSTWNRTDALDFIKWYKGNPSGSKGPWDGTSFSKTFFTEDISVSTWNRTDALPFIKWYRDTPTGSPSPFINFNNTPTGIVAIIGTPTQGETLTVFNNLADADGLGTISYQWFGDGSEISGATSETYVLTQADVGNAITVTASYVDAQGTEKNVTSSATSPVVNINDDPTGIVAIIGIPIQGETLTASNTLADADGLGTISYQWFGDSSEILGATSETYVLTQADVGKAIMVTASYTDGQGTAESVTSSATSLVANTNDDPTGIVAIIGIPTQGETLTASHPDLADADGLGTISYQWFRDGSEIPGATSETYVLTHEDVGKHITVTASYTDGQGTEESVTSSATLPVVNINDDPIGNVTIIGTPIQGEILTASNNLADADGLGTITYTWSTGVIRTSILLTQADVGTAITVTASYADGQGTEESITSEPTSLVAGIINSIVLNTTNTEIRVTFMVDVYNATGGSGDLEVDDFALSILSGVTTIDTTPVSITKISGSVWVLELDIPNQITATGNETLKVVPTTFNSIYNGNGDTILFQSTVVLNDTRVPITDDNFGLAINTCLYDYPVGGNDINGIYGSMSGWDVSNVTYMGSAFINKTDFNGDLSRWNVSNVRSMSRMFDGASDFNSDLSSWDTSAVIDMSEMFTEATSFNKDLSSWDVSNVRNMSGMFIEASSFNGNISSWDTSGVLDMSEMFHEAPSFNGDLSMWDTSAVIDMADMFDSATAITTVSLSKTGAVTNMFGMFRNAKSLTTVTLPETGAVMNMGEMFCGCDTVNATGVSAITTVTLPKTGAVTDMSRMFLGAALFNQDIRGWDVDKVLSFNNMFLDATAMKTTFENTPNWPSNNATPTASWFIPP